MYFDFILLFATPSDELTGSQIYIEKVIGLRVHVVFVAHGEVAPRSGFTTGASALRLIHISRNALASGSMWVVLKPLLLT
jgi:hypothetical protein